MVSQGASHYRMPRWIATLFALTLALSPAFGQFGGIQLPGRNGRNSGGQQRPGGSQTNKVSGPSETLTGSLRDFSSTTLVIDTGDDRIVLVQIQKSTKYLSTMGKVKASDFEPGDHVTIEATRDDTDHYYANSITMNKKGSAADKAAAMTASNTSSASGGGSAGMAGDTDSDPDRPRLRRSGSDGDSISNPQPAPSVPSRTPAVASAPSQPVAAPRGISGSGSDTGSATISRRPAVSSPPVPGPTVVDDSGPPVLRRSSGDAPAASRPSLSAEDVNGVTKPPVFAQSGPDPAAGSAARPANADDDIIEQARNAAFTFSDTLPNYVVRQITNRYATGSANRGRTSWQPLDIVTTDLVYEEGKERYTNIMVNGKPTKDIEQTGSWSEGEFASMLQAVLSPATDAEFTNRKSVTIANHPAYRYDYVVTHQRSTWTLHADGHTWKPAYAGSVWFDKATYRVLRIELAARDLPRDFPMDTAESSIDYDFVLIGSQKVLLPSAADSLSCTRGSSDCTRNHTEFHNYRKFGADTNITFEGAANQ